MNTIRQKPLALSNNNTSHLSTSSVFVWVSAALLELWTDVSSGNAGSFYTIAPALRFYPLEKAWQLLRWPWTRVLGCTDQLRAVRQQPTPFSPPKTVCLTVLALWSNKITPPAPLGTYFPWSSPFTDSAMRHPGRNRIMFCLRGTASVALPMWGPTIEPAVLTGGDGTETLLLAQDPVATRPDQIPSPWT